MLQIIKDDPWLAPYENDIQARFDYFKTELGRIDQEYGSLLKFASRHYELGFHQEKEGIADQDLVGMMTLHRCFPASPFRQIRP